MYRVEFTSIVLRHVHSIQRLPELIESAFRQSTLKSVSLMDWCLLKSLIHSTASTRTWVRSWAGSWVKSTPAFCHSPTWRMASLVFVTTAALAVDDQPDAAGDRPWTAGLTMFVPLDNATTAAKARLGESLFNDHLLSADGSASCASCHDPRRSFTTDTSVSHGVFGRKTARNAPSLFDVGYMRALMWDGRVTTLEAQVLLPLTSPAEMGASIPGLLYRLESDEAFPPKFAEAFGSPVITLDRVVKALASYQRTLASPTSTFDVYYRTGTAPIPSQARRGWLVFRQNCARCHAYDANNPFFSDFQFRNTGIAATQPTPDNGRFYYTGDPDDRGRFRTPPLRNLASTAPYMHDGSLNTLDEVIDHYQKASANATLVDFGGIPIRLSDSERALLLAFLQEI